MKVTFLRNLTAVLVTGIFGSSAATGKSITDEHLKLFKATPNLSVEFAQTSYRKLRDRYIKRQGNAKFSQPSYFKWRYKDEKFGIEEYYFDGKKFTHYIAREKTANIYDTTTSLGKELQQVVDLVLNTKKLLKSFRVAKSEKKDRSIKFVMEPKKADSSEIQGITAKIDEKKMYISYLKIIYKDGNSTTFDFKKPNKTPLNRNTFTYQKQPGVKIQLIR